ncbi:hypothetical protein [Rhodoplanes serenus]|uniref:hypothetical protein n=1 Tax=Rhodoplanes serenus TaxID=200615 RepID=UPI000DAC9F49|nr:hypothetical protein [Rhodoplanes serenus]RAI33335.1 hypothetical protein CH340_12590 [Rhodoplanes serenus]
MEGRYFEQKRIAEMLRCALAEMAALQAEQAPSSETVDHVERWTLRWIDLVEAMIADAPTGDDSDELRGALERLRAMALPRSRAGAAAPGAPGLPHP